MQSSKLKKNTAASEKDLGSAQSKWELFDDAVTKESLPKNKVRKMIGTLDEDKEWAALHYAVDCNNEELCSRLTSKEDEYQCDVNILGGNGENVLHIVSQSTCIWGDVKDSTTTEVPALVKLLVEKRGADVNHADDEGRTPLHMAAMRGRLHYIKYLIDHEAKVDVELELIKYLIKIVRIEVDAIGDRRLTPLHIACEFGHLDVVKYLIEKGASTTLRNAQLLNCLEICIEEQHVELVKYLLQLPNWREMMRNAQTIEDTDAYDTPMRKLIRYMPDVALWVIEEKLTRKVGGAGQKVSKEIYDYEFYEDMNTVKQWYAQGAKLPPEDISCKARCHKLGVSAIFGCYISTGCCNRTVSDENTNASEPYTRDAYTLVRNHPLMIVSQQSAYPQLMAHQFHILLRKKMFRRFSTFWLAFSFLFYLILLGLWTAVILSGKHPQYFYDLAGFNMTLDINTCQQVANSLVSQNVNEVFKTAAYRRLKVALYIVFWMLIAKNGILVIALFPKIFRVGAYYVEAAALVLSFVYILDWYDWQNPVLFRCPFQYQIGAMGLAVGEIPTLMVEGTLWRNQMLYDFVSDGEILRLQFLRLMKFLCCYQLYRISRIRARPIHLLTFDDRANGWIGKAWYFTKKHFFEEKIQDDVELKISSNKDAR
ncbi:unnamed protein product [Adineta steineri]|nr:unnamed protein product [Adineta steineri]